MDWAEAGLAALGIVAHEMALLAASGFVILGLGDLAVDFIWLARALKRRRARRATVAGLPPAPDPGSRIAIFTPAWDEAAVIGAMLAHSLRVLRYDDYLIYVGCYPNDRATIEAVGALDDPRVRLVIGTRPGPTTKADCLNQLWTAMTADEAAQGRRFASIVLHDAEDVIHPDELRVLASFGGRYGLVQLPVQPMIDPRSPWVSAHYADEFAESHGKEMVVRGAIGAALPSAGVGCAFSREALATIAARDGQPFDALSLTEDYELGLKLKSLGFDQIFVRIFDENGDLVATKEYFPSTLSAAVRQKGRWMAGIALSGWDRLGWSGGAAERWMRFRDRQSLLAACLLFCGYASIGLGLLLGLAGLAVSWRPVELGGALGFVLSINLAMLCWRLGMRVGFVGRVYGIRQGLLSVPRILVANLIAILAALDALGRYSLMRRHGRAEWGKTEHMFPADAGA